MNLACLRKLENKIAKEIGVKRQCHEKNICKCLWNIIRTWDYELHTKKPIIAIFKNFLSKLLLLKLSSNSKNLYWKAPFWISLLSAPYWMWKIHQNRNFTKPVRRRQLRLLLQKCLFVSFCLYLYRVEKNINSIKICNFRRTNSQDAIFFIIGNCE